MLQEAIYFTVRIAACNSSLYVKSFFHRKYLLIYLPFILINTFLFLFLKRYNIEYSNVWIENEIQLKLNIASLQIKFIKYVYNNSNGSIVIVSKFYNRTKSSLWNPANCEMYLTGFSKTLPIEPIFPLSILFRQRSPAISWRSLASLPERDESRRPSPAFIRLEATLLLSTGKLPSSSSLWIERRRSPSLRLSGRWVIWRSLGPRPWVTRSWRSFGALRQKIWSSPTPLRNSLVVWITQTRLTSSGRPAVDKWNWLISFQSRVSTISPEFTSLTKTPERLATRSPWRPKGVKQNKYSSRWDTRHCYWVIDKWWIDR